MAQPFNADEIFEIAEQIERNGAKFYRTAAENTEDANTSGKLRDLAAMEDRHERIFIGMHEDLRRDNPEWLSQFFNVENQDDPALYLRAMAEGKVFDVGADPSARLSGDESLEEVLTIAIGLEKDSIVYYVGVREAVPPAQGRGKIDDIIREEMSHVRTLSDELHNVTS